MRKTYPYRFKRSSALAGLLILPVMCWWAIHLALTQNRGVVINHVIHLSPTVASGLAWLFAICLTLLMGPLALMVWSALAGRQEVRLFDNRLEAPKGMFSKDKVVIAHEAIKRIHRQALGEHRGLHIEHRHGRLSLNANMLPKPSDIDDIHRWLLERTQTRDASAGAGATEPERPAVAALMRAIEEGKQDDPLIGAKLGGREVWQRLFNALKTDQGVHIESLLCMLGALAGYACQMSLRAQALKLGRAEAAFLIVVDMKNGERYFHGDALNAALLEAPVSVWSIASSRQVESRMLVDVQGIVEHVSQTVGEASFGMPRMPQGHQAGDSPLGYLKVLWPQLFPTVKQCCAEPETWPMLYAFAIQEVIDMGKEVLQPQDALTIVMECAIPMSKVDLAGYLK